MFSIRPIKARSDGVGTVECAGADNGIVHAIEAVLYLAYYGSPIAEVINIRIDFGKSHFFRISLSLGTTHSGRFFIVPPRYSQLTRSWSDDRGSGRLRCGRCRMKHPSDTCNNNHLRPIQPRVVYVGKIPLRAFAPVTYRGIVIGVGGGHVILEFIV